MSFNKITIVGNLGRDPELRYTPQGKAVCELAVATNAKRGEEIITTWFKVKVWDKQAENVSKYLSKGTLVYLEGRLRVEEWTDRDGRNRFTLEVSATDVQFIGERTENVNTSAPVRTTQKTTGNDLPSHVLPQPKPDDDVPF